MLTIGVFLARLQGALDRYDRSRQVLVIAAWREDSPFPLRSSIMLIDTLRSAVPIIFSVLFGIGNIFCFSGIL